MAFSLFGNRDSTYEPINAGELNRMIESTDKLLLLDVREPFELTAFGKIPNVVNIPLGELKRRITELPEDKDTPIVSICQSGNRSKSAAAILHQSGYTKIYNLEGGTIGWLRSRK